MEFLFAVVGAFTIAAGDGACIFSRGYGSIGKGEVVVAKAAGFVGSVVRVQADAPGSLLDICNWIGAGRLGIVGVVIA